MKASVSKHKGIIVILVIFFIIKLIQFSKFHFLIWDEAVYVAMGKWFLSGGTVGMYETIRPIVFPLILGAGWKAGLPIVGFGEFIQILFSMANIYLVYAISKLVFNKATGIVAAIVLATTPVFFLYSNYLLVGITSTCFVLLAIYLFIRKQWLASGVLAGLAFLTRFPQGLMLIALLAVLGLEYLITQKQGAIAKGIKVGVGFAITLIPFFIVNLVINWGQTSFFLAMVRPLILAFSHQNNPFEAAAGGWFSRSFYYFIHLFTQNWVLAFFLLGIIILALRKLYKQQKVQVLIVTLGIYLAYFSYIINKQERFALAFLPVIAIFAGYGIMALYGIFVKQFPKLRPLIALCFIIAIASMFIHPLITDGKYMTWRYEQPPPIVTDFYMYFQTHPTTLSVLTADPVPAAYSDALFIPAVKDIATTRRIIQKGIEDESVGFIIFKLSSYPCLEGDSACLRERAELIALVESQTLIYNKTFFDEPYQIYRINHSIQN